MRALCHATIVMAVLGAGTARADENEGDRKLDWEYALGLTLPEHGRFPHRFLFRWNTESYRDGADTYAFQYGRGWRWNERFLMKLSVGYAGTVFDAGKSLHELAVTASKDMTWGRRGESRLKMEGTHYFGREGYRYRGYYAFDWWFLGAHVTQEDKDTMIGFQVTSGPNAEVPLRVEARHSFELFGDAPAHVTRIVVIMDTD